MLRTTATIPAILGGLTAPAVAQNEGETYTVDMNDELKFVPEEIRISPGDTIVWENIGTLGHTVTAYEEQIPSDAEYFASGGFDSEQAARDAYPNEGNIPGGDSYSHTFEVEGSYEYFCIPHEPPGMIGTVEVAQGATPDLPSDDDDDDSGGFTLPGGDIGFVMMAIILGISAVSVGGVLISEALQAVRQSADRDEPTHVEETDTTEQIREISHDDFDPIGTATLIAIYLAIVVAMWIFVYFVEFLGNGPTVIG